MRCLLAVDSGGTKCEAIAVGEDGSLLGRGLCGYTGPGTSRNARGGSGRSPDSVHSAIRQALRGVPFGELHVAGYHQHYPVNEIIGTWLPGEVVFHPVHEHEGALQLAGLQSGVIVSAGTGAFVHVVTDDDRHFHIDSLGPMLGDHGSAYHIGTLAVQAAAKSDWHPRHRTSLKEAVYKALNVEDTRELGWSLVGVFERQTDRAVIASLARLVDAEARKADQVALAILDQAAAALAETVYDAYDSMKLQDQGYSLVGTGSVIRKSAIYRGNLSRHVGKFAPDLAMVWTELPHVVGTAMLALEKVTNGNIDAAKQKLLQEAKELESE